MEIRLFLGTQKTKKIDDNCYCQNRFYLIVSNNMAVPKQRHTKSRRDKRRAHIFLKAPLLVKCQKCGKMILPHIICWNCGYYKGEEVIDVMKKLTKKERKKKEKEIAGKEKEEKKAKPLSMEGLSKK